MIPSTFMNNQLTGQPGTKTSSSLENTTSTQESGAPANQARNHKKTKDFSQALHNEATAEVWAQWIRRFLGILVVIGLGGAVYLGVEQYTNSKSQEAFDELFRAEKLEEVANREASALKISALEVMKKWPDEKKKEFSSKLQFVLSKYPSTTAGSIAGFKLGRWQLDLGNFSEAEGTYRELLKNNPAGNSESNLVRSMAVEGLAVALENQNRNEEAEKVYTDSLGLKNNPLKPVLLLGAARLAEKLGKTEASQSHYKTVLTDFPNTEFERRARALLARLDLKSAQPPASASSN